MNLDFISGKTRELLDKLSDESFLNKFTLVGGTALSIQAGHRLSEDLDFIFDGKFLDSNLIKKFIHDNFKGEYKIVRQDNDHQLDMVISDVKVTFFTTESVMIPFNVKDFSFKFKNINIAGIDIIAVMKLSTIAQRSTIRDYYDLFFISKHLKPLGDIFENSRKLLPHLADITYTETIIYTDDLRENSISQHLNPKEEVTKEQLSQYFTKELKKLYN